MTVIELRGVLVSMCSVMLFCSASMADTINVPADQPTIQAGIDAAVNGDEVVVAPGTYDEVIDLAGKAITVRSSGGAEVTTIDAASVPDPGDGVPVVRIDNGEGADTIVEGFTLTGGTGDTALFGGGVDGFGGGIWINGATPTIRDCIIEFNNASNGGGVFINQGSPTFDGCTIGDNDSTSGGGAGLYLFDNSGVTMTGCTVSGNDAANGGAMFVDAGTGTVVITDSTFENNTAAGAGGAINSLFTGVLTIDRCVFRGNTAGNPAGGAMYLAGEPQAQISNSSFIENTVTSGGGGAISATGDDLIVNCSFSGNTGTSLGGALDIRSGDLVVNCSFAGNDASNGAAIFAVAPPGLPPAQVLNCVFWGNTGSDTLVENGSGQLTVDYSIVEGGWSGTGANNLDADPLFADASNHDLTLLAGSPATDSGDSLSASPHVGAFDLAANPRFFDEPSVADTGIPVTSVVIDRGAYEFGSEALLTGACCVGDGCAVVTEETCAAFGGTYFGDQTECGAVSCEPDSTCLADIVSSATFQPPPDGMVDGADLAFLLGEWGACR